MTFGSMFSSKIYNNFYNTNIKIKQCFSPFFQKFKLFFFLLQKNKNQKKKLSQTHHDSPSSPKNLVSFKENVLFFSI